MPDVFLPAINPVDVSSDNDNTGAGGGIPPTPPAGGLLGDGDLTSNDGDASGWEAWNSSPFLTGDPGNDAFRYEIDTSPLPPGAVITGFRFEMTTRLVEATPQGYPRPAVSSSWSPSHSYSRMFSGTAADFTYATTQGGMWAATEEFLTALADGSARLVFGNSGAAVRTVDHPLAAARGTMGGIRVYYTEPVPSGAPILRVHPRSDGRGLSSARRVWPPSKAAQDGRWLPYGGGYR